MNKIDFVVTWVDGNDPNWQVERNNYLTNKETKDNTGFQRYRDWDLMRFWFRGVETFAPWVNKVYFVTCGQKPEWLNTNANKLICIKHSDYMPIEYLPTFNSNAIEVGLNNIKGLSEHFVLFNDDFFPINVLKENDFFKNGMPCDYAALDTLTPKSDFEYSRMNNMLVINQFFNKKDVLSNNKTKWVNFKDIKSLFRTIELLKPWTSFSAIRDYHCPIAFNKSDFECVWSAVPGVLKETQSHRFRSKEDNTVWLIRYWRLMLGRFYVKSQQHFGYAEIKDENIDEITFSIEHQQKKVLCLNDEYSGNDYDRIKERLTESFLKILPNKSSFEI